LSFGFSIFRKSYPAFASEGVTHERKPSLETILDE